MWLFITRLAIVWKSKQNYAKAHKSIDNTPANSNHMNSRPRKEYFFYTTRFSAKIHLPPTKTQKRLRKWQKSLELGAKLQENTLFYQNTRSHKFYTTVGHKMYLIPSLMHSRLDCKKNRNLCLVSTGYLPSPVKFS